MKMKTIEFTPANKKQARFMSSTKPFLLLSGATECGKSYPGCWKIFIQAMQYPGGRWFICRKEAVSLKISTLVTLFEIIPEELIVKRNNQEGYVDIRTSDSNRTSRICWFGLDKKAGQDYPTKIGSTEFVSGFFDETIEGDEGDFQMLATRLRYRFKHLSEEENNKIPRQLIGATNPDSELHHLYIFFFESDNDEREVIMMTPYENPYCTPERIKRMEETLTGLRRERLLLGKWVQAEGAIYDTFSNEENMVKIDLINSITRYKHFIGGADSNFPKPRAGIIIGITSDNEFHIIDEFYKKNAHPEDLGEWFNDFAAHYEISIIVYHDPSDPSAIDKIDAFPNIICEKAMNPVNPGIDCVHKYVTNRKLKLDYSCIYSKKYLMSYKWKKGSKDIPEKEDDHLCFVAGTRVQTINGEKNIEEVEKGDYFLTREGFKKMNYSIENIYDQKIIEITLSNGQKLKCTHDHPFFVKDKGWIKADSLRNFYILVDAFSYSWQIKYLMEEVIIKGKMDIGEKVEDINIFIEMFGNISKEKYLKDLISIIRTKIKITTKYLISNVAVQKNIDKSILGLKNKLKKIEKILIQLDHLLKNGMQVKKEKNGIVNIGKRVWGKVSKKENISVNNAVKNLLVELFKGLNSVTRIAKQKIFVKDIKRLKKRQKVYNLNISDCHEYFANGVLVSNCDSIRYALFTYDNQPKTENIPHPEFMG